MKILLVEDTRSMAALMMARLTAYGYEVSLAENGEVAVEQFRATAPDLVLMDIEMPVMNGFEATSRIRAFEAQQKWAWTPVIFLTASDSVENLVQAIEAGGDDFLTKLAPEVVLRSKMKAMTRIAALRQQLSIANRKLEEQASRDGLTGLCNRRYMDLRTDEAWHLATQAGAAFGLLMLDVDNFKKYNDHYGHQMGDDCLRAIARALESVLEASNAAGSTREAFAARYGGEEFAVIIPQTPREIFARLAEDCLVAIREQAITHEKNADWGIATASIGGAWSATAQGAIVSLFRAADANLYRAKESGRNRAVLD